MTKMKRLLLLLLLLLAWPTAAHAADFTFQSETITGWYGPATAELWIFSTGFRAADGTQIPSSSPQDTTFVKKVTCSVNTTTHQITIPSFVLKTTQDAADFQTARYTAYFYTPQGRQLKIYFSNWSIPAVLAPREACSPAPCGKFVDLQIHNQGVITFNPAFTYSAREIDQKILANVASGAPIGAKYLTQEPDSTLAAEQPLNSLTDGLLKHASGVVARAVPGTDFLTPTGDASGVVNLNASQLASGTVPDGRFPATLPVVSGANLTNLNATNLASGTVPLARLSGITTSQLSATAGIVNTQLASATATPTATSIPISDGSNKLAAGWLSEVLGVADLSDFTGKSGSGTTAIGATFTSLTSGDVPQWNGTNWVNAPVPGTAHNILSATHTDSTAASATRGGLIVGKNASPKWELLTIGVANRYLSSDGTDVSWGQIALASGVTGTLPIANGGTNSSTALSNGRVIISSGGAIVERAALTANAIAVGDATNGVAALALGTAHQIVKMNAGATANVYGTLVAGANVTITPSGDNLEIAATGALGVTTVENAGTPVTQRATLNIISPGLTAVDNAGKTELRLPSAGAATVGLVDTSAQTWAGAKTFNATPVFATMTQGSVLFAGASGTLTQDNTNLFWDDSNNRLGLLTASPAATFHIGSAGIARFGGSDNEIYGTLANKTGGSSAGNIYGQGGTIQVRRFLDEQTSDANRVFAASYQIRSTATFDATPNDKVALYAAAINASVGATAANVFAFNSLAQIESGATARDIISVEVNVNNNKVNVASEADTLNPVGIQIIGGGSFTGKYGLVIGSSSASNHWWGGIKFLANSVDEFGIDLSEIATANGLANIIKLPNTGMVVGENQAGSSFLNMMNVDATDSLTLRSATAIKFGNNDLSTEYGRFNSGGNLLIGTTQSVAKLVVAGPAILTTADATGFGTTMGIRYARGSLTVPSSSQNGDQLFALNGYGYDGTSYLASGLVQMLQDGAAAPGAVPGKVLFATATSGGVMTPGLVLTSAQRLWVNTSSASNTYRTTIAHTDINLLRLDTSAAAASGGAAVHLTKSVLPTAADQEIGSVRFGATNAITSDSTATALIQAKSSEAYTLTTNQGTYLTLSTTPTGSITPAERMRLDAAGNIGLNQTTFGTSAAKVIAIASGTAPTTSPADAVQLWVADAAAGDANLFARNETGKSEQLTGLTAHLVSNFAKTSDTALAAITFDKTFNVEAGKTYSFEATLHTTSNTAGGIKLDISGTATATSFIVEALEIDANVIRTQNRTTSLSTAFIADTAASAALVKLQGTIVVNAAGTLTIRFAQNVSNGAASTVLAGSYFRLIPN